MGTEHVIIKENKDRIEHLNEVCLRKEREKDIVKNLKEERKEKNIINNLNENRLRKKREKDIIYNLNEDHLTK